MDIVQRPKSFEVENLDGRWRVRIDSSETRWLDCDSEHDARLIAQLNPLKFDALEAKRSGEGFAKELETLADALQKYNLGVGARFMRRRPEEARERGEPAW